MNKLITFFTQSSEDPTKTSATLTGILIGVSAYLQQYVATFPILDKFYSSPVGLELEPTLTAVGMIVGGVIFLFGLFRKLTNKVERNAGLRVE